MKSNDKLYSLIINHMALFESFNSVYLFGSVLNKNITHNDIDLLLVYEKYSDTIRLEWGKIEETLEKASGLPVDLTVLSVEEEKETCFIDKLNNHYIKIV